MNTIKLPVKAVQEMAMLAPQVWYALDADGNKVALSNKESVDAIVEAVNRQAELEAFVQKFLDNFIDCDRCDGTGLQEGDLPLEIPCDFCDGVGKKINSRGVLLIELPEEARMLLKAGKP